ncbi:FimV/HubP family polar landmark protein [Teredinibacter turnerae]
MDFEIPEIDPEGDDDLGFLSDSDETATKLDLARAYIDMGDAEGAKDILDEIMKEGTDQQKQEAEALLSKV